MYNQVIRQESSVKPIDPDPRPGAPSRADAARRSRPALRGGPTAREHPSAEGARLPRFAGGRPAPAGSPAGHTPSLRLLWGGACRPPAPRGCHRAASAQRAPPQSQTGWSAAGEGAPKLCEPPTAFSSSHPRNRSVKPTRIQRQCLEPQRRSDHSRGSVLGPPQRLTSALVAAP